MYLVIEVNAEMGSDHNGTRLFGMFISSSTVPPWAYLLCDFQPRVRVFI